MISEGGGDHGSVDDGGTQRHVGALPPVMEPMVPRRESVEHGPGGEGGAVPDGLHPREISSSI